jgi:hypothetical protein
MDSHYGISYLWPQPVGAFAFVRREGAGNSLFGLLAIAGCSPAAADCLLGIPPRRTP